MNWTVHVDIITVCLWRGRVRLVLVSFVVEHLFFFLKEHLSAVTFVCNYDPHGSQRIKPSASSDEVDITGIERSISTAIGPVAIGVWSGVKCHLLTFCHHSSNHWGPKQRPSHQLHATVGRGPRTADPCRSLLDISPDEIFMVKAPQMKSSRVVGVDFFFFLPKTAFQSKFAKCRLSFHSNY